jgi:hypothetical protein
VDPHSRVRSSMVGAPMRAPPTPDGHGLRHDTLVRIRRFRAPRRRQSFRTYRSLSLSLPPPHACERFHRQARLLQVQYRTRTFTKCRRRSAPAGAGLKKRCVLRGSRTCRPVSPPYSRIERPRTRGSWETEPWRPEADADEWRHGQAQPRGCIRHDGTGPSGL